MNSFFNSLQWIIGEALRFISPPPVALEWLLMGFAALLIALLPLPARLRGLRTAFHRLAGHRRIAILLSGLIPIAIRLALLGVMPVPEPSIHDEFSHLLLADTLAHGRLANPTHPMWKHFESIHIIQQPTYSSMYPPAQGAFLAVGQVLFHEPWAGVVISVALMGMAVCWMMQAWLPPAWAFYGSLIVGLKIGIVGLWMNSYMGGAPAAIGGALVVGALPRLKHPAAENSRAASWMPAAWLGLGMVILMNSRPFDGAVLSLAALVYLAPALLREKRLVSALIPAAAVIACGVAFTGYYNWRVTGNPARMAYQVNRDTYGWPENLAFLPPKKITLRDPVLNKMYLKEIARRETRRHPDTLLDDYLTRLFDNWIYFFGPVLTIPLVLLPRIYRDRRTRPLVLLTAAVLALNLFQLVLYPYHLAVLVAVMFAIVAQGVRHIYVRLGYSRGATLAIVLPVAVLTVAAMKGSANDLRLQLSYWDRAAEWHRDARAYIAEWLSERPGKQLVVVHYGPFHEVNQEWVYNDADIDSSKVVWAREVNPKSDAELLRYFHDRQVWLLKADETPQRVVPYPRTEEQIPDLTRRVPPSSSPN